MLHNVKNLKLNINSLFFTKDFSILSKPSIYNSLTNYPLNKINSIIKHNPKYKPKLFGKKFVPKGKQKKPKKLNILLKNPKIKFGFLKKKFKKQLNKRLYAYKEKRKALLSIFTKRNPYILVRKNYKSLFTEFFTGRLITPLTLDFLHLAYFKLNKTNLYKPRIINKMDSYAKRMYKFTLNNYKNLKLSPYQYIIALMNKTTHFENVLNLYNKKHRYNIQLHQLFFFQKAKKYDFVKFLACPDYINPEAEYVGFNIYDALKYNEYKYMQKIQSFYYPVTEIHFKETNIHGKPMKTKLPRRV